ncbi:O-antigen polymerase [Chitinophaga sp. RAB17]|uniref:O-antigen polymerase n=1 Tax=Chitinophaga sp. RAB17 TaxID=3233049 RepID=UPI003F8FD32B
MSRFQSKFTELFLFFVAIAVYIISCWWTEDIFVYVKLWSLLTLLIIYGYLRLQTKLIIFSPINLFCIYYSTIVLVDFYYMGNHFDMTPYLEKVTLHHNYITLFNWSSFYYFVGLISIILGFSVIKQPAFKPIKFENKEVINPYVLNLVVMAMMGLGILNFFYNVLIYAGGNPLTYLSQIALRKHQFEEAGANSGTTVGYIFYYMGTYLLAFSYLRKDKNPDWLFWLCVITGAILQGSNGRIYSTIIYFVSFIAIFYFRNVVNNRPLKNKTYIASMVLIPILAIATYFLRLLSSLKEMGVLDKGNALDMAVEFKDTMAFSIIDKGNMPNTAIFIKVLDSWKTDHGYMYGESLVSWMVNILPSAIKPIGYQPSAIIKNLWYAYVPTGNLPPTGVAEMYINFGPVGPFLGMFALGVAIKAFYVFVIKSRNYWNYLLLILISLAFIMIYPKGEFDNLNFLYVFITYCPFLVAIFISLFLRYSGDSKKMRLMHE